MTAIFTFLLTNWATSVIMTLPLRLAPLSPAHLSPESVAHFTGIRKSGEISTHRTERVRRCYRRASVDRFNETILGLKDNEWYWRRSPL